MASARRNGETDGRMNEDLKLFGFATGEVSDSIRFRSDIDKYSGSCRLLKNFDVDVSGAVVRRRGFEKLADADIGNSSDKSFLYAGNFCGRQALFVFSMSADGVLRASYCLLDTFDKVFTTLDMTVPDCDYEAFEPNMARFRQYNDVLILCGRGIPPCELRVSDFGETQYPSTATVYESREEDPTQDKNKSATLVNAITGEYRWTYNIKKNPYVPDLSEAETHVGWQVTTSHPTHLALSVIPNAMSVSGNTFSASFTTSSSGKELFDYGWYAEGDTLFIGLDVKLPRLFLDGAQEISISTGKRFDTSYATTVPQVDVYTDALQSFTASLPSDRYYSFDCRFSCRSLWQHFVGGVEDWSSSQTITSGSTDEISVHFENLVYSSVSVTAKLTSAATGGVIFRKFPFTIPPSLSFGVADGGAFSFKNGTVTLPPANYASYDDKIPLGAISDAEVFVLEDTSGESHYLDWGKWDASNCKKAGAVSETYYASGNTTLYFFSSGGRWCGQLMLEVSYDPPEVDDAQCSWVCVGSITGATDGTLSPAVSYKVNHYNARVRVRLESRSCAYHYYYEDSDSKKHGEYAADMGCKWTLKISGERRYYFKKSSGTGESFAVTKMNVCPNEFSTARYSVGAFNKTFGYPLTCDIAQQRLWFFSTDGYPKYFWASKTDDIANFSTGSEKTDGLCFEGDSGIPDYGRWLKYGKGQFQFGCSQSEGNLVGKDNDYSLNPTSLSLENESAWGSSDADACLLGDKIFYIKAGSQIIHAQVYDSGRARYVSGEVNVLAHHLFMRGRKAVKLVGLRAPETALFVLRADGSLARFVFNEEQNVGAWSHYTLSKPATDICALMGSASDVLVAMFREGNHYTFASMNPLGEVWTDFGGEDYESEIVTNAMSISEGASYGGRSVISKLDLYGVADEGCAFEVSFDGGASYKAQYRGIADKGLFSPNAACRRISWSGRYSSEAAIGLRTRCRGAFELLAVGANIVRSDIPAAKAFENNQ